MSTMTTTRNQKQNAQPNEGQLTVEHTVSACPVRTCSHARIQTAACVHTPLNNVMGALTCSFLSCLCLSIVVVSARRRLDSVLGGCCIRFPTRRPLPSTLSLDAPCSGVHHVACLVSFSLYFFVLLGVPHGRPQLYRVLYCLRKQHLFRRHDNIKVCKR